MKNNRSLFQELVHDTKKYLQQESLSVKEIAISSKELSFYPTTPTSPKKKEKVKSTLSTPAPRKQIPSIQPALSKPIAKEKEPDKAAPLSPKEDSRPKKTLVQETSKDSSKKEEFLALLPLEKPQYHQNSESKKILQKIAPDLPLLDEIPDDSKAIFKKTAWRTKQKSAEIVILTKETGGLQEVFLQNVAEALESHFATSKIFSMRECKSAQDFQALFPPSVKLIIAIEKEILNFVHLLSQYRQIPSQEKSYLGEIPILFIKPPHIYLEDPKAKRSLWKLLCQKVPEVLSPQSS